MLRVRARVQRVSRAEPRPRARPHLQAHADVGEAQGRGHRRVRAVLGGQPCRAAGRREYGGAGERENGRTGEREGGLEGAGGAVVTGRHGHTGTGCRPCAHVLKPCAHMLRPCAHVLKPCAHVLKPCAHGGAPPKSPRGRRSPKSAVMVTHL